MKKYATNKMEEEIAKINFKLFFSHSLENNKNPINTPTINPPT
jgi:hypothetical protein